MRDARIDKLAEVLIQYCTGVRRGEATGGSGALAMGKRWAPFDAASVCRWM